MSPIRAAEWLAISAYSLVFYLRKAFLPIDLPRLYELPVGFDPFVPVYLPGVVVVLAITSTAFALRRRYPCSWEGGEESKRGRRRS